MSIVAAIILVWILQSTGWALSQMKKRQDLVDIFWGPGIALVSWVALLWNGFQSVPLVLITLLTTAWAARLSWHIWNRNKDKPEDPRYVELSKNWKNPMLNSYLNIWLLQGGLMILIGFSALMLSADRGVGSFNLLILGLLVWGLGFYFEHTADKQLANFKKDPANSGKIMTKGLWGMTRHPNYFGEVVMWWGIWILALSGTGLIWGIPALVSPVAITYLILKVSGIPMAEARLNAQARPDWEAYKKSTNAFFPWPHKK